MNNKRQTLSKKIFIHTLIVFALAVIITFIAINLISTNTNERNYEQMISSTLSDVEKDIMKSTDVNLLDITYMVKDKIEADTDYSSGNISATEMNAYLKQLAKNERLGEISIGNDKNVLIYSSQEEYVGFDMNSSPDSAKYGSLNHGTKEIVEPVRANAYPGEGTYELYNKYAGVPLSKGGYIQTAISQKEFQYNIRHQMKYIALNRHIGSEGYVAIINANGKTISSSGKNSALKLSDNIISKLDTEKHIFKADVNGEESLCVSEFCEGYFLIGIVPYSEVQSTRNRIARACSITELLIFLIVFVFMLIFMNKSVVSRLRNVTGLLRKITAGNLDTTVSEYSTKEFYELSTDINSTVASLKEYTEKEKSRLVKDIELAREIQYSVLPNISSIVSGQEEFDLFATMDTARQVGGDFYDFYLLENNKLAILCADVSGKGIPAAMFMMRCKTLLEELSQTTSDPGEMFNRANSELCKSNTSFMFVTAWMGILDLKTGHVDFVNAGHNPPLVYNSNGEFEFLKSRVNMLLVGNENVRYVTQSLDLKPGDRIFLYTDGVTEANDPDRNMYGNDRLLEYMNLNRDKSLENILHGLKEDIDAFADGAEPFDDITMLILEYRGSMDA